MPKLKIDVDIEKSAIEIIRNEKVQWEDATAFITEKVAFQMRNLIRNLRKNYWGIFDKPTDPQTGKKKIWIPLTESLVDSVVKNIDIDTKDISFLSKKTSSVGLNEIIKNVTKNHLDEMNFGEDLDDGERRLAIDGTLVWKLIETTKNGKRTIENRPVDLLNVYIDPTAPSIQDTYRFTERALLTEDEVRGMKGWINTEDIKGTYGLSRAEADFNTGQQGTKLVDVWELWGKIPRSLITGKKKDTEEVDGHIVVSGIESAGNERVHLIKINSKKLKPYEEAWYIRVPGRWYGKGVAEKVLMLQLWINTIVNIRITRAQLSQMGIFKIRNGSGITPQMLSRLAVNGAIAVNDMGDLEQLVMQEASQASYKDEDVIQSWAERVTSAFETVTGEPVPASTTATAVAVQSKNAQSQFTLVKKQVGFFIKRYLERHAMPVIMKNLKKEDVIRVTGDIEILRSLDEAIVNKMVYDKLEEMKGEFLDVNEVMEERQRALDKLASTKAYRYYEYLSEINPTDYDVTIEINGEEVDKGVLSQNLLTAMQLAPQYQDILLKKIFEIMGLDATQIDKKQQAPQLPQGGQPNIPTQNPAQAFTQANIA